MFRLYRALPDIWQAIDVVTAEPLFWRLPRPCCPLMSL